MCGIAGIYSPGDGPPVDAELLRRMTETLFHRGPDDAGYHVEPDVGLGFRRLSIIDVAGGHQPMFNEDRSVGVVFNGEIYNFRELRAELVDRGHRFQTSADTEVLVHGWEVWGPEMVPRLRGMFAFALWDRGRRSLFLARDRLGIKPLYYGHLPDGSLVFGSELKALLACPTLRREVDPQAIEEYFSLGYVPDPRSIFAAVRKLPPAHTLLLVDRTSASPAAYWDVMFREEAGARDGERMESELLERLDDSVESHLVSDVPLGAFLSGGIDSSAVVSSMARALDEPVRTCSITFQESRYDEGEFARLVAGYLGTDHSESQAEAESFHLLDKILDAYDEPFSDNSALPTYLLCRLARMRVKVAISGDGGDETLAGYRRYVRFQTAVTVQRMLPSAVRTPSLAAAGWVAARLDPGPRGATRRESLLALGRDLPETYERLVGVSSSAVRDRIYTREFVSTLQGYRAGELLRRYYDGAPATDPLSRVQYLDLKTYLPGEILTKVDRASMAHSLEVRVPLLDHPWVEWAATLPPSMKLHRGVGKAIFRRALRSRLPAEVLGRGKKGFSIPVADWLRGPLRELMRSLLLGPRLADARLLDPAAVRKLVEEHLDRRRNHAALLWAILMFQAAWERLDCR